jgi:type IV pilus assembly protein PilY1
MKTMTNRLRYITGTAVLTLWCCLAQADDIEVYLGSDSGVRPTVVMVIDTSGSMRTEETVDTSEYDPSIDYKSTYPTDPDGSSIDYKFDSSLYYFSSDYTGGTLDINDDVNDLINRSFPPSALVCEDAIPAMLITGYYTDSFKRWNTSTNIWDPSVDYKWRRWWYSPDTPTGSPTDTSALIECKSDEDLHPAGKYVNTDPDNSSQYTNSQANNYSDTWDNNFRYVYHGNFLNYKIYVTKYSLTSVQTRMEITVAAAKEVAQSTGGITLGLSRFNSSGEGGRIDIAVDDIENIRDEFVNVLDTYSPNGYTPLEESFHEAALYLRGDSIEYGSASVAASRSSNTYVSPITSACQNTSGIVLFTDGEPYYDTSSNNEIRALLEDANIDFSTASNLTDADREVLSNSCSGSGGCAEELAYYLARVDQRPDLAGSQTIRTHVIGGFFDEDADGDTLKYMEDIAYYGLGTYTTATNKDEITAAFKASVAAVADDPITFVAPAVAANAYNSLEHLDDLYYAVFVPSSDNAWQGNLKSYRLSPDGTVVDAGGDEAIGTTGLFLDTSRSYWTAEGTTDGSNVAIGGAAANLTSEHNIFTHLTDTKGSLNTVPSTDNITKTDLGLDDTASDEDHSALIDWINRKDGEYTRSEMEDPLHSRPIVVNYSYDLDETDNSITANGVVFIGTNSGYLHAFKADKYEFKEYFSFIPKELLSNANLYRTADEDEPKTYGIDGPINYWHADANQNSEVDNDEKVYLFFGLRRGGRHYYALDISDPENPKFQWKISGGLGDDFDKMGQSWSAMTLAKVNWEGKTKVVLLFGGGYDNDEDDRTSRAEHSMGNSVYMIDPESGDLLWSASNKDATTNLVDMTSAITSDIETVDFDGDQITDYFFVSDLGGRIWRFDIDPETTNKSDFIAGAGMIFDANKNSSDYQRFYYAPSVSYFVDPATNEKFLTLAIGSGFRAHPLEATTQDSFYIIKDSNIITAPATYTTLEQSDLVNIPYGSQLTKAADTQGWQYDLSVGEKVLATPLTSNGNMYFTTFAPLISTPNPNTCNADIGTSMAYTVDFLGDDDPTQDSISPVIEAVSLPNIGIAPQVIEVRTSTQGQEEFCERYPSHESCQPDPCEETNTCPDEDECEEIGSVILSGTNTISGGITRCELLKKDYWRSL